MKVKIRKTIKKKADAAAGLEQLFGSGTRYRILRLVCCEPEKKFFVREMARLIEGQLNAVRREIEILSKIGVIVEAGDDSAKRKFYRLNTNFVLADELSALVTRANVFIEKRLVESIKAFDGIDLFILTGSWLNATAPCDLLIVGNVKKEPLVGLISKTEKELGKNLTYSIFTPEEYKHRKSLADKFLYGILEAKKIVAVDKLGEFETNE
jgi:hypothetical protein